MTRPRNDLTAEYLRSLLNYDALTGLLTWKITRSHTALAGSRAGYKMAIGYICIMIDGRSYLAHRLAWLHYYGEWPSDGVDHRDGDKANNPIVNLRTSSQGQNCANVKRRLGGCSFNKRNGRFAAKICVGGKQIHLGYFDTREEGEAAYLAATVKYHGEFSIVHRPERCAA